jgi:hypothetical protein
VTLVATDNVIADTGDSFGCASAIVAAVGAPTTFDATIARNRLTLADLTQCGGIEVVTSGTAGGTVTVEANELRGSNFDFGIELRPTGTGALEGTIVDNLVVGQNGNTGSPGGIVLYAGGDDTPLTAAVVNNTVANGRTGICVGARTDLGGTIDGVVANNVLAFNTTYDLGIDPGIAITNDHNLVTSTGGYGFDVGPGTLVGDPRFVDAAGGDFHLLRASPGVDSGRDSALDPAFAVDLDGATRRNGRIDRGAYEAPFNAVGEAIPAGSPVAVVLGALTIGLLARRRLRVR